MTMTMIRTAKLTLTLALPALLAAGSAKKSPAADALPAGSFWVGAGESDVGDKRQVWAMAIHIDEREGDIVRASAWYPTLANGVSRLSGVLDGKGGLSVDEPSIVWGKWDKTPGGIVEGGRYTGRVDTKNISVSGAFKDPKSGASIPCSFTLSRAQTQMAAVAPARPK